MSSIKYTLLAAASLLAAPAHALVIGFDPAAATVTAGDSFNVDILLDGLDAAGESVSVFDLSIGYDPAVLAPVMVALGPGADAIFSADTAAALSNTFDLGFAILGALGLGSGGGPLSVSAASLAPPGPAVQGDSVLLARLTFEALAAGFSDLLFLDHPAGSPLNVIGNDPLSVLEFDQIGSGRIQVQPVVSVPVPGTLMLLGAGLLLIGARRLTRAASR